MVSGLQKTPSLCSFMYLQLFKFASGSYTDSIVPVMLKERSDSLSLSRHFSGCGTHEEQVGHFGRSWDAMTVILKKSFSPPCLSISNFCHTIALLHMPDGTCQSL